MAKKKRKKNETSLPDHRRHKKELRPPLADIGATHQSWMNDRMPDMLWAVLAIGAWDRDRALQFFRHIITFVAEHPEAHDITLTGIGSLPTDARDAVIDRMCKWDDAVRVALRPLLLFPALPGLSEWERHLDAADPAVDWSRLAESLPDVFDHQSQEATDCRWVKFLCQVVAGKVHFPLEMKHEVEALRDYPDRGDMRSVRPMIRAAEMAFDGTEARTWSGYFWKYAFENTGCVPANKYGRVSRTEIDQEREIIKTHYFNECVRISHALIDHAVLTATTTAPDARHEGAFGLAYYATLLISELLIYRLPPSLVGRLTLRTLVEVYITFAYLLAKDDSAIWMGYRSHGSGQAKLVYLKLQELAAKPKSIDEGAMETVANEDLWQEFVVITLGHWDGTDLRRMSEDAGVKDVYDKFYAWSSGYVHATWAGVRDVAYENCLNPLHRFHRFPAVSFPLLPSVLHDSIELFNEILTLLGKAYPEFNDRIQPIEAAAMANDVDDNEAVPDATKASTPNDSEK
jgi:Family of unknown function (DUF5677)